MLSLAKLHQMEESPSMLQNKFFPRTTTKTVRSNSSSSDGDSPNIDNVVSIAPDNIERDTQVKRHSYADSIASYEGTIVTRREVSQAMSINSKRDSSLFTTHPLYDTQAIWKHDPVQEHPRGLRVELGAHLQRALDRYFRTAGHSLDFKSATNSRDFLAIVTNDRLRYMPSQGSRLDKVLKEAEAFAKKFDKFMLSMQLVDISNTESPALVLSSCKLLLGFAQKYPVAVERFFTVLNEAATIMVRMAEKVDPDTFSEHSSSILESTLAIIVDIVVDITATFKGQRQGGSEKSTIILFESRFEIVLTRLTQLKAELQMQILARWLEHNDSKDNLIVILRGCDLGLDTCPPSYLHTLIAICHALQPCGQDSESLKWFRLLWASYEKHRHDCDIPTERWFDVHQEYTTILEIHEHLSERIRVAEEFRAIILADFGTTHHFYVRASIELGKLLEVDEVRYKEAVAIFEEISQYEIHLFEERDTVAALIEISKCRLSILLETYQDLAHRAENLLTSAFVSLKVQFGCSHEKVLIALTRVVEYYRKQKRRENIKAVTNIIEEYIVELLVEERSEKVLFSIARSIATMYRELSSVEVGLKFLQIIKDEVALGELTSSEHCGFKHDQLASLDRRCFVFIYVLEQLLCGYEREGMLNDIIADIFTESCLSEAWFVSLRQNKPIHVRLASGSRLLAFLELKARQVEVRRLRTEMWEMFREDCSGSTASEHLWQLFELSLNNVTKKVVSIAMLELLVHVALDFFSAKEYEASLHLLQWSQIYFKQLTTLEHSRVIELAFKVSGSFSAKIGNDRCHVELHRISSEILVKVLKFSHLDVDLSSIPVRQLNMIIRLLGEQKNFSVLERILQYLWDTRMSRSWTGVATVATGRRLCEVKFAAGHHTAAIALLENICYNLRDVYGSLHKLTVECQTLRASFHNTCGNHLAARDIHVHLLEEIVSVDPEKAASHHDLFHVTMDQAKRLRWACHHKVEGDHKEASFYSSLFHRAHKSVNHLSNIDEGELREAMAPGGEKQETKWKMPEDWSLPIEGEI